jgi:hypothetical protein
MVLSWQYRTGAAKVFVPVGVDDSTQVVKLTSVQCSRGWIV